MAENYLLKGLQGVGRPMQQEGASALTEEEKQRIRDSLYQAAALDNKDPEDIAFEEAPWSSVDSLASAQRFFSGMALGVGDEIGIAAGAAIAALFIEDTPFSQIYKEEKEKYDRQQREFQERQPEAALTADIAGAVASPASWMAAPARLAALAPATGAAGTAARVGGNIARAGVEGAIYGAGTAEEGQRLEGAQTGALYGAGGYTAIRAGLKGLGLGGRALFSRKIEGDLVDETGDFIPITLAAKTEGGEDLIRTFYRDVVAPSFGAKGVIRTQEDKIIGKAEDLVEQQKSFTTSLERGAKDKVNEIKDSLSVGLKQLNVSLKQAKEVAKKDTEEFIAPLSEKLKTLQSGKAEEIFAKATKQTKQIIDSQRFNFRNSAFLAAMPATAKPADIARILQLEDIGMRAKELDALWNSVGYSMIKGKKIRIPAGKFEEDLMKAIDEDAVLKVNITDVPAFKNNLKSAMSALESFTDKNRRMDGDLLSAVRSRVGTIAANAGDPQLRRAYYTVQSKIDDIIKNQLTPNQLKAFNAESSKWKSNVLLRDAIESTRKDPKKRGVFTESDWLKSAANNSQYDARYGTGPLVGQARSLEQTLTQTEKSIARRAAKAAELKAKEVEGIISKHKNMLEGRIRSLEAKNLADEKRLRFDSLASQRIAENRIAIDAAKKEISDLTKELDILKRLRSPQNPTWYHSLAATNLLASLTKAGAAAGVAGASVLTAGGFGKALASPTAQRIIAGQTPTQQAAARAIASQGAGQAAETISRAAGRGMLTGE
jgi:hypothetical protein